MKGNDYILLIVLFLIGFFFIYAILSKTDRRKLKQSIGDSGIRINKQSSGAAAESGTQRFSNHPMEHSEGFSKAPGENLRQSIETQSERVGKNSAEPRSGDFDKSGCFQKEILLRAQPSLSCEQKAELYEVEARDTAAIVMKDIVHDSADLLQRVYRMNSNDAAVLLSAMSIRLKEKVDGGWEPEEVDLAGFEVALKTFLENGAGFVDHSGKDLVSWGKRSEDYKVFLRDFACFLGACALEQMIAAGVSRCEAATMLVEQTDKLVQQSS